MIPFIIEQWEQNKHHLKQHFNTNPCNSYDYRDIVKLLFEHCILKATTWSDSIGFDIENMTVIDDGSFQGTTIYIIPKDTIISELSDYIITHNYYGSCSGCDTLLAINSETLDGEIPKEQQVIEYMTVALHLVQKMKWLGE